MKSAAHGKRVKVSRRRLVTAGAVVVCLAAVVTPTVFAAIDGDVYARSGRPATLATYANDYKVGQTPVAVAFDGTSVWTANQRSNTLSRVDRYGAVETYGLGTKDWKVSALVFDGTYIFAAGLRSLLRVRPGERLVSYPLPEGAKVVALAYDGVDVWIADAGNNTVLRFNRGAEAVLRTYALPGGAIPTGLAFDGNFMWVAANNTSSVYAYRRGQDLPPTTIANPGYAPRSIVFDGLKVWTINDGHSLSKFTLQADSTIPIGSVQNLENVGDEVYGNASALDLPGYAAGAPTDPKRYIWSVNTSTNSVSKIDLATGTVVDSYPTGAAPTGIAFDGTHMWITQRQGGTVAKIRVR